MHTLFTLKDRYGLETCESDSEVHLRVNVFDGKDATQLHEMICAWKQTVAMLKAGKITQRECDRWCYRYPEFDTTQRWLKVPLQELVDTLAESLKKESKEL